MRELRDSIQSVRLEGDARAPVLHLTTKDPLEPALIDALEAECRTAAADPISGTIAPVAVTVGGPEIRLFLEPIDPGAARLSTLFAALESEGSPVGGSAAARITSDLACTLERLHRAGAPRVPRVHGDVRREAVLLDRDGSVRLIGPGTPILNALLVPAPSPADGFRILAPEAARGEPIDGRSDFYALGVLYYELLSGQRYRKEHSAGSLCQLAIEGRPPDLPGALPDPRPSLIRLLEHALAPEPEERIASLEAFALEVLDEAKAAGIAVATPGRLGRMLDAFLEPDAERGAHAFVSRSAAREERDPDVRAMADPPRPLLHLPLPDASFGPRETRAPSKAPPPRRPTAPRLRLELGEASSPLLTRDRPPKRAGRLLLLSVPLAIASVLLAFVLRSPHRGREQLPAPAPKDALFDGGARTESPDAGRAEPAEIRPIGLFTVLSQPSGADVEIDGGYVGKTPLVLRHQFVDRTYRVTVRKEGHHAWDQAARPDPKTSSITVMAILKPTASPE